MQTTPSGTSLTEELNGWLARCVPRVIELGIRVVEAEFGRIVTRAPMQDNSNHLGSMYAGTLFGMAEVLGGLVLYPNFDFTEYLPTVKEVTIRYRRPARTTITATATVAQPTLERLRRETAASGRSQYVIEAVLTDTAGEVVARTAGTYQLLSMALVTGQAATNNEVAPRPRAM